MNLIPFALNRENPEGYYNIMTHQENFIENHRNIPINNIPLDANNKPGIKGHTLLTMLNGNTDVLRVAYDPKQNRYHVSTRATTYRAIHHWISNLITEHEFPYGPTMRPLKYGPGNSTSTSYSSIFKDVMQTPVPADDASTIKTTRSNAWKNRPPLAISYVPTDDAFPPLTPRRHPIPTTPSTTSETLDEDTIQSAISSALKKLEEQHQRELLQLQDTMQKKIDAVANQMKELGKQVAVQTYQALVTEESPLVTKTDHAHLQQEMSLMTTQLKMIVNLLQISTVVPQTASSPARITKRSKPNQTPEKAITPEILFTQEQEVPSATSILEEEMEGCEE